MDPCRIPFLPLSSLPLVIRAVQENSIVRLKSLIEGSVDVNAVDGNGHTALHYAACEGQNEMVQELLLAGADRTVVSKHIQETALSMAIWNKHQNCISSLISEKFVVGMEGGSRDKKWDFLRTVVNQPSTPSAFVPLIMACAFFPSVDVLLELLEAGAQVNESYDSSGTLPIHHASSCCSREIIELLLAWGADPKSPTKGRDILFPLSFASRALNLGAFKALLGAEADPNACEYPYNAHSLVAVCQQLDDEHRKVYFFSFRQRVPTKQETIEMITFILQIPDMKLDHQEINGNAALHYASRAGCMKVVQLLLDAGANATVKNVNGKTPAEETSDPAIRKLLKSYQSNNAAHIIGYNGNVSLSEAPLKAIGFTRRKQCLVSSEGASIEAGSVDPGPGAIDQPEASRLKEQTSGISFAIPENSLSETVAVTLNYTPNPPVLSHRMSEEMKRLKALPEPLSKMRRGLTQEAVLPFGQKVMNQAGDPEYEIVSFSLPVANVSKDAKATVISPYVTITVNKPVALSKESHVTLPHCAEATSQSEMATKQFEIIVREQSLTEDGRVNDWKTLHGSKVKFTDNEARVSIDKLEQASTYVAVATSTTGQPIREVITKRKQFWILGNPVLEQQMDVAAVCCTNAYRPAKLVAQLKTSLEDSSLNLKPWHLFPYAVVTEKDIKVTMSTSEEDWSFDPTEHLIENDVIVSSPDAIHPYQFCLDCKKSTFQKIRCNCRLEYDGIERRLAFHTPQKVARTQEERMPALEEGKTDESGRAEASALIDKGEEALCNANLESETDSVLVLDNSLSDVKAAILVVAKVCSSEWLRFGLALGYGESEVKSFGCQADNPEGKLELVIRSWMDDKGKKATLRILLDACNQFRKRGKVEDELEKILSRK